MQYILNESPAIVVCKSSGILFALADFNMDNFCESVPNKSYVYSKNK